MRRGTGAKAARLLAPLVAIAWTLSAGGPAGAQGDGPRSQLMIPQGLHVFVPTYLDLSGNYDFSGSFLLRGAEISPQVFIGTYLQPFSIAGRYAQLYVNPIYGELQGEVSVVDPQTGQT